jgi:MSHA biogenesis protein MshM
LPKDFFRDLPSFLNIDYDTRNIMTIWFVGLPQLSQLIDRVPYAALASRISARVTLKPIIERERFSALLEHAFKEAGSHTKLLSDTGIEILRQASQGRPRLINRLLTTAMRLATTKGLAHLTDEILQVAIEELK